MHDSEIRAVIRYVLATWQGLAAPARPPCLWLRLHGPLPQQEAAGGIVTPLEAAWFVDRRGLRQGDLWAYARFHAVHLDQRWCARIGRERDELWGEPHRIGIVAFARCAGGPEYLVEMTWAGRHGEGQRVSVDARGEVRVREHLWIS